jgi:hypothetical protein
LIKQKGARINQISNLTMVKVNKTLMPYRVMLEEAITPPIKDIDKLSVLLVMVYHPG